MTDVLRVPWPSPAPYACSLSSSDIDLSLRDDLSASVQDYLLRIVEELHELSKWTAACHSRVVFCEQHQRDPLEALVMEQQQHQANATLLLAQTETRLLRTEMEQLRDDVAQRAAIQLAYVENAARSESGDQWIDIERRVDDKLRGFASDLTTQAQTARADADSRIQTVETSVRELARQLQRHDERLTALKQHVAASVPAVMALEQRLSGESARHQQQLEQLEVVTARSINELKTATAVSLGELRDAQTQLATKLDVVRIEMRQQRDEQRQRMQVLTRVGQYAPRPASSSNSVVLPVGATALIDNDRTSSDCFLHAKATLGPRRDTQGKRSSPILQPKAAPPLSVRDSGDTMEAALRIHSSTLCQPLGHEDDDRIKVSPRKASVRLSTTPPPSARRPHAPCPETAHH